MPVITRSMKGAEKDKKILDNKSKKEKKINPPPPPSDSPDDEEDDVDEKGNIKDLIDYSYDEVSTPKKKFNIDDLQSSSNRSLNKHKKRMYKKKRKKNQLPDLFMSYILLENMNKSVINSNNIVKSKPITEIINDNHNDNDNDLSDESLTDSIEEALEEDISLNEDKENIVEKIEIIDELNNSECSEEPLTASSTKSFFELLNSESSDSLHDSEDPDYDEGEEEEGELSALDEEFLELMDDEIDSEEEFDYFYELPDEHKHMSISMLKEIKTINKTEIPLKFKVLNLKMDLQTKSSAIHNIDKMNEMDPSSGEYVKMDKWINGLIKIPFGEFSDLKINSDNSKEEKREFIINTKKTLDSAIYGHKEAKMHILQVIGQWITNPKSNGNVLALQGPMGNGKTTLVKEGIAKAIGRPFAFIALGGTSDSSFFDGHSYTYEGSHWGRIIDILMQSKCMNPVIYFDELDKVSETYKGQEVIHFLTHLTDQSQNSLFQDNYFPGINIDLSKCLFIFSFNDESKVDRILKDRMYVIHTKGFETKEKIEIAKNYLLPELLSTFMFDEKDIILNDSIIEYIINNHTDKEEGVRNLKRCIETIISKINIYNLSYDEESKDSVDLTYTIKDFKLPLEINNDIVDTLLKIKKTDGPPTFMYM